MTRDENGFICLDKYKWIDEKNSIIEFNKKRYFFKEIGNKLYAYNELLAEELGKDFDILCAHYDLVKLNDYTFGVISEIFTKENERAISIEKFLIDYQVKSSFNIQHSLSDIWNALESKYNSELVEKLMNDIVNIFIFDIFIDNSDRHEANIELIDSNKNVRIAPIFDNEYLLNPLDASYSMGVETNPYFERKSYRIEEFLKSSDSSYKTKLEEKLWIISEENIKKAIKRVEEKIKKSIPSDIKAFYLEGFKNNKEEIEEILVNFNNKRKR